ncbi:MAG: 23S rRNA (adenine2503-C2)-methyltransferase, partial [Myxococcota bacterium]
SPRRRIYIEYVMLGGVNDSLEDAARLPKVLEGVRAKINLIPFNPYPGSRFKSPDPERVVQFLDVLMKAGIQTNIREPKGRDIQAACGMLDGDKPL